RRRREEGGEQPDRDEAVGAPHRRPRQVSGGSLDGAAVVDSRAAERARATAFEPSYRVREAAHPNGGGAQRSSAKRVAPGWRVFRSSTAAGAPPPRRSPPAFSRCPLPR